MTDVGGGAPDWRHDPRASDDIKVRVDRRRRWSRVGAVVAAALLVVGGTGYFGFVTGRLSLPGLGTLTSHPADVSTVQVGNTTYLLQDRGNNTIGVSTQITSSTTETLAVLAVPGKDAISWTRLDNRTQSDGTNVTQPTYVLVLPAGAHNLLAQTNDSTTMAVVRTSPLHSVFGGADLLGVLITIQPTAASDAPTTPGLAAVTWQDSDGRVHTNSIS